MGNQAPKASAFRRATRFMAERWGVRGGSTKHDHYFDFGWPENLVFDDLYRMYCRNSLAAAGVDKTISKTWQDFPELWETEKPMESTIEADIRQRFDDLRIWQMLAEADRRSMVGRYSGVIIRLRDDLQFHDPVAPVRGGLDALAGLIPFWETQLTVSKWNEDPQSEDYGQPAMFEFSEAKVGDSTAARSFKVHPSRVLIWSGDGTINGRSSLEPGFNDLIDAEKIKGAGGEGFWKTSRGAPILEAPQGMSPVEMARGMGTDVAGLLDAVSKQVDDFQSGFDKALMLGGMVAKPMTISLPSPEHFFAGPVNGFAASLGIPVKILLGSQTGERASTEDAKEWAQTCHSRRVNRCRPLIAQLIRRLEAIGVLVKTDWFIHWTDLAEASPAERMARASLMADINTKAAPGDEPPFTPMEIRAAAGFTDDAPHLADDDDDEPPTDPDDPPGDDADADADPEDETQEVKKP